MNCPECDGILIADEDIYGDDIYVCEYCDYEEYEDESDWPNYLPDARFSLRNEA